MLNELINKAIEIIGLKTSLTGIILVTDFIRNPDIYIEFYILQDFNNNTNISKKFIKRLFTDKETKKQYFKLDDFKYYIKTKVN